VNRFSLLHEPSDETSSGQSSVDHQTVVVDADRWSVEQITADARRLGVEPGDVVMVHASLRSIGPVAGGADGVIDALLAAVGDGGTLFMNVGARDDRSWVNEHPEHERADLLRDTEPFDNAVTPADPDNGVLAEVFRRRARLSDHPEGRFGAIGPLAPALLDDVPWNDYYGVDSPLERFVGAGGRVLRLGADPDTVTLIHYAENLVELPRKRRVRRHRLIATSDGPALRTVDTLDDSDGIVDRPGEEDYFLTILRGYLATGRAAVGVVGHATSELIDGNDLVGFAVEWMAANLAHPDVR
jgi:aminoglycoside N3'-acetyltransferase